MSADRDWPVEFRFIERAEQHGENIVLVRHLQVRYRDDNTGVYFTDKDSRYTAWADVPVVEE